MASPTWRFGVKIGFLRTAERPIWAGVSKASLLAPELYILHIYDMTRVTGAELTTYVGDITIHVASGNEQLVGGNLQRTVAQLTD